MILLIYVIRVKHPVFCISSIRLIIRITDLFSFQSWWKKQTNSSRNRFKNCIRDGYVLYANYQSC